jgi:hypothetical protein
MFSPRRPTPAPSYAPLQAKRADTVARKPSRRRTRRAPLCCLSLAGLLLAGMSCSHTTVIIPITHSPASDLRLSWTISDQYSNKPTVQLVVQLQEVTNTQVVGLAKPAHLTCNGQDIMPPIQCTAPSCARQPPGGAHQIAYTDEHGATTTLTVPVPNGVFALLSPQPGAQILIPRSGELSVRFSLPLPASQASLEDGAAFVWCGAAGQQSCGGVVGPPAD